MNTVKRDADMTLAKIKHDVEQILEQFYIEQTKAATHVDARYQRLWSTLHAAYAAGGKRLRPYLLMTAYQGAHGNNYEGALYVAAGIEMLHTAMLVHDDIVDRDTMRHGQQNPIGRYQHIYRSSDNPEHYANGAALIIGDLAISGAYQLIVGSNLPPNECLAAAQLLGQSIFNVGGGQLLDMEASFEAPQTIDSITIALLKTASYSFIGPLTIGATLAGADSDTLAALTRYGEAVGVMFQLTDDLLGIFGDEAVTGKSSKSDLTEGKATYLVQQALHLSNEETRLELLTVLGNKDAKDITTNRAKEIIIQSGARDATERTIQEYAVVAHSALIHMHLDTEAIAVLEQIILDVSERRH